MMRHEQARQQFENEGISIKDWAEQRGYSPRTVYAVLNGALQGKRGVSHRIAVDLGLKPLPQQTKLSR